MDDEVGDSRKSIILINQKNLWLIISLYRTNDQEITEKELRYADNNVENKTMIRCNYFNRLRNIEG